MPWAGGKSLHSRIQDMSQDGLATGDLQVFVNFFDFIALVSWLPA